MCVCVCVCVRAATVFNNANQHINVYGDDVEVDYRGYEVGVVLVGYILIVMYMYV